MTSRSETGDRGRQPPRDCLGGAGHRAPCCRWRSKVESAPCSYRRTSTGMYCTSTRHECVASGLWSAVVCREKLHVTQEISGACLGHCGTKVKHTVTTSCSDALLIVYSSRKPGGLPAGAGGGGEPPEIPLRTHCYYCCAGRSLEKTSPHKKLSPRVPWGENEKSESG